MQGCVISTSYLHFTPHYKKIKMVHKRTPYTINALKSVKFLIAFNASGDVKVLILTYTSFHLPGGLMPYDIITVFVYFESSNYLLLDLQQAIEPGTV